MSYAIYAPLSGPTLSVLSARGVLPLRGAWAWEVELDSLDSETPAKGSRGVLVVGGRSFSGYVQEVAPWQGRARLFFEAGAAGMRAWVVGQGYHGALVSTLVEAVVSEAGEELAGAVDSSAVLEHLQRAEGPACVALTSILSGQDMGWRFDDAGRVRVAVEEWATASEIGVMEMQPNGADASLEVAPLRPSLSPGTTWRGRRIERVIYHLPEGASLTARLVFERATGEGDLRGLFERAVRAAVRELAYLSRWPTTVAAQQGDRLELAPDDEAMARPPPMPVLLGLPGCQVEVPGGARVGMVFEGADQRRPRAMGWEQGTAAGTIRINPSDLLQLCGGEQGVARVADTVGYMLFDATAFTLYFTPSLTQPYAAVLPNPNTPNPPPMGTPGTPITIGAGSEKVVA